MLQTNQSIQWKAKDKHALLQRNMLIHYFAKTFNLDPLTVQFLMERRLDTEEQMSHFLFPSVNQMHNPFLLHDMKRAIVRIIQALKQQQPIVIFGDYDVDGMTATALLARALRFFGGRVHCHVPLREEGYGLSVSFVQQTKQRYGSVLLITVDNGSSATEAVLEAKREGIDVIITDHHEVVGTHPPALAFINPKRVDNTYPFPHLAGVGVAFKVAEALFTASNRPWSLYLWDYVELACLGTVADMMPLVGENRVIASLGLQKLNNQPAPFFHELKQRLHLHDVTSADISFRLAPILNASGRIDNPNRVVQLLLAPQVAEAEVEALLQIDKKRKQLTTLQFRQMDTQIRENQLHQHPIIVVHGEYEEGIMGILAAKITNTWHKPAIVIAANGKASCRGGGHPTFSMINAITDAKHFLKAFGGHKQAAGFSIDVTQIESFQRWLWQKQHDLAPYTPIHWYDSIIQMGQFPLHLWDELALLEPFGIGNTKPIFFSPNTQVERVQYFGLEKQYFKCQVGSYETLSFQKGDAMRRFESHRLVDFLYTMGSHHQFLIEDVAIGALHSQFLDAM